MKKTLALILALLMMLSVALVSCGSDEPENTLNTDDIFDIPGGDDLGGDNTDNTENEGGDENNSSTAAGYTATNDTVYVCYKAVLRSDDKVTASVVATVEFETALTRVAKGKKWSQINYNGTEAYIANDLITESKSAVTFKEVAADTTRKIKLSGDAKNANLRLYPLALTKPQIIDLEAFNTSCIIGQIPKDTVVTVIKVSEDNAWAYVECQGYAADDKGEFVTTLTTLTGYCSTSVFDTGFGTVPSNPNGGALG